MKCRVFLAVALIALTAAAVFAQTEADFEVTVANNAVTITKYKGSAAVVVIPEQIRNLHVLTIGKEAFDGNNNIISVVIPNYVTTIGEAAFNSCEKLAHVVIPNSVITIGMQSFSNCKALTSIIIPAKVQNIGDRAFEVCSKLTTITFMGSIPSSTFATNAFDRVGDVRAKFYATNTTNGTVGTYTRANTTSSTPWTKL
jgi:hypothetical protein